MNDMKRLKRTRKRSLSRIIGECVYCGVETFKPNIKKNRGNGDVNGDDTVNQDLLII